MPERISATEAKTNPDNLDEKMLTWRQLYGEAGMVGRVAERIAIEELRHSHFFTEVFPASEQEDHQKVDFFVRFAGCPTTVCDPEVGVQYTYSRRKDQDKFGKPKTF